MSANAEVSSSSSEAAKELTVVCVSYKRYREIHVLINSLLSQTLQNWKLLIIHDGPDAQMEAEVKPYLERYPDLIRFQCTETRYNDYGHTLRKMGIEAADTEFVLLTNDDNYYARKFLQYMFDAIREQNLDMVLCNMIHSHKNPGAYKQLDYNVFDSYPSIFYIDVGNFILRTSHAKAVGFNDTSFNADGVFVEDVLKAHNVESLIPSLRHNLRFLFRKNDPAKKTLRIGKVDRVLFVHN
jgi:glycosyltransferase involved in cell wall biosynthesis